MKRINSYSVQVGRHHNRLHDDDATRSSSRYARRHPQPAVCTPARGPAGDALSRALWATVALGLITAPAAQAAMAGPMVPRPAGGGRRALQDAGVSALPCAQQIGSSYPTLQMVNVTQALQAPPAVQALITTSRWQQVTANGCGTQVPDPQVRLTYAFDTLPADANSGKFNKPQLLSPAQRAVRRQVLAEIAQNTNTAFTEVPGPNADANIYMFVTDGLNNPTAELGEQSNIDNNHTYAAWTTGTQDLPQYRSTIWHELGHVMQLGHPFAGSSSATGYHLPVDGWPDDEALTVMSYSLSVCYPIATHYGPLDLDALSLLYGPAPQATGGQSYLLDDSMGVGGLRTTGRGNTLVASTNRSVAVNLGNTGNDVSVLQQSSRNIYTQAVMSLSPSSIVENGDISDTLGGTLVGNALDNILVGSDGDDLIGGRGGNDRITTGAGRDTVWLEALPSTVVVEDFDVENDRVATSFDAGSPSLSAIVQDGVPSTALSFAGGPTAVLLGVLPQSVDLQRHLQRNVSVNLPYQGGNCTLQG